MTNNIKISVITGIYYPQPDLFKKFLYSCLNQTLDGIQFIFIHDDPKDIASREIIADYQKEFNDNKNTFTVLENDHNLGIYATQMKGLKNALGEYVVFFDNDDFFDLDYLETLYKYAKEFDANVIKGFAITHHFDEPDLMFSFVCKHENIYNEDDWLYMYKKSFFARYFKYNTMYTSDTALFKKIKKDIQTKELILQIPLYEGTFYHYIRHATNSSSVHMDKNLINMTNDNDVVLDQLRIYERFLKDLQEVYSLNEIDLNKNDLLEKLRNYLGMDKGSIQYNYAKIKDL